MSFTTYPKVGEALPKKLLLTSILLALATTATTSVASEDTVSDADAAGARAPSSKEGTELESVRVEGSQVKNSSKYTELLRDTPQTITIVPQKVIKEQNLLSLRDILSTLPGITFGAGEGGGGYGDSINLRGFSASNDITMDGVRDSAQYSRTDPFNLEQVELTNGANSVYSGAGSVGGTINLVSKTAREGNSRSVSAGVGSDSYLRGTADINQMVGEHTAVRLNLMAHENDVPSRDYEKMERWGFAPSIAFGLGTDTQLTLSYLHQKDENLPQYGVPYFRNAYNNGPLPGVDSSSYFGYHDFDKQENTVDAFTATLDHRFNDSLTIRNLTRTQKTDQLSRATPPQGTWCLPNGGTGINVSTGAECATPGYYARSGPAGTTRDSTNRILYTQTDLTWNFATGPVQHTMVSGFALTHETYHLSNGNSLRNADGSSIPFAPIDIYNPDSSWGGPVNFVRSGQTWGELDNQALYVFDTMKFSEQWSLNLGARYERNDGKSNTNAYATPAAGGAVTVGDTFENSDNLFSYRGGLVFKPVENGTIYVSYGNSKTPSKASVNGSCTAATCSVDPETAVNYELGTKWDFAEGRLSLSGSVFRNERTNYKVADANNPNNPSGFQQLDGSSRVDGITLGISGRITDSWSVYANYAYLDSEVLQSVSDAVLEATGIDAQKGNPLTNTPENSVSLWTTYDLRSWQFGYGATYSGDYYLNNSGAVLYKAPDYVMHRAMVAYRVNRDFGLQFNVNNLTDKEYYTRIRNNGWATPGDGRSYTLTATYNF